MADGMTRFSILDVAPIFAGGSAAQSLSNTLELAQHADRLGYHRFWLAEHHNMPVASAATSVVIGHVAAGTKRIRVGAGGIMLPNHAPLVIAEQFGTLATLFPDRIDLGIGRAPGTDQRTMHALRRHLAGEVDRFPQDVVELQTYFAEPEPDGQPRVRAVPGEGLRVPIWLLGSSLYSAQLAAALGLPFAFASHFAPADLMAALELYRAKFTPSPALAKPHAMAALNVVAAKTDAEAARLFTSRQQWSLGLIRGRPGPIPPPVEDGELLASPMERAQINAMTACSVIGSPETVRAGVADFIARTQADELIVTAAIYDRAARLRSFEILADVMRG